MKFRAKTTERLAPDSARRQGHIARLAFTVLGREAAIAFLNGDNATLGARPIDLAIASNAGCARVEAELGRLADRQDTAR
jgi:uncharacterized protein (DUF2384 family)